MNQPANWSYSPPRKHIVIPDTNSILDTWLRIAIKPNEAEWDIRSIAIYATKADAEIGSFQGCLADDIQINTLPEASRLSIYGALNVWEHERRQRLHQIAIDAMRVTV